MGKARRDWQNGFLKASTLSFEEWVDCIRLEMAEINWRDDLSQLLGRVQKFYESSDYLLERYGPEELNKLLWNFIAESGLAQVVFEEELDLEARLACVRAIKSMYVDLFENYASRALMHGVFELSSETSPLNSICYMWWDVFPSWGKAASNNKVELEILNLLAEILEIDHPACRESAIHGLGHWHLNYPAEVEAIIDRFLEKYKDLDEDLLKYACAARCGCVN